MQKLVPGPEVMTSSDGFRARPRGRAHALAELKQKTEKENNWFYLKIHPGGVKPNMS